MNAFEALISRSISKRIRAEIDERGMAVMIGMATDHADYCKRTAYIRALSDVLVWISESETEATKPEDVKNGA